MAVDEQVRALAARYTVETVFDEQRARRPFDMTHGRRGYALNRMADELRRAGGNGVEPTRDEIAAAFDAMVRRRVPASGWRGVSSGVVDALVATGERLELDEHPRLAAAREACYVSGGSRGRR